jgi:hypothetical protein
MWIALKLALSYLIGNKTVQAIALNVVKDLVAHGKILVPIALDGIRDAAAKTELSGSEKFSFAVSKVTENFPTIERSIIDTVVQTTYQAYSNPEVKELS